MVVVFDTADIVPAERMDATIAQFQLQSFPARVTFDPCDDITAVMELWRYGTVSVFRARTTGHRLSRTSTHIRRGPTATLAIAVQETGVGHLEQHGAEESFRPGDLMVVDLDAPYVAGWDGTGAARSIRVPMQDAGVHPGELPELIRRIRASPLHGIVARHIWELCDTDSPADRRTRGLVGAAGSALVHGLFATVRDPADQIRSDALMTMVADFVRSHLTDPGLSAGMIADNLGVSVTELRQLATSEQFDLDRWMLAERLRLARHVIARQGCQMRADQSRSLGFADRAHFAEEFSAAYGLSPQEWLQVTADRRGADD
ncbi:hypothetical protein [Gordonia hankookensis]|uniref:HTH araC/xylS-type domain-containing protein n=1 Tax=Gordonia hankookensis TaxID=589403 RepID=A0ABR7WHH5_9ACTN|nr:hypothetical protein [Gordonia hankookensis]MBD1322218.1 hypothetical protein [Gordonia hankookensis]